MSPWAAGVLLINPDFCDIELVETYRANMGLSFSLSTICDW